MNKLFLIATTIITSTALLPVANVMAAGTVTPTPTNSPTPTLTMTPAPTKAVQSCQTTYGGGTTCETTELVLDKKVKHPTTSVFVDNLGINDPKYNPDGTVSFVLKVTNTGTTTFNKITVTDTLPDYIKFTDGDSKTHSFTLENVKPNETRTIDISAKISTSSALPSDQGITCIINAAKATADGHEATDTATFCVEKKVLSTKGGNIVHPVPTAKTTPPTGPEAFALVGLIPTSIFGFILRKKALRS